MKLFEIPRESKLIVDTNRAKNEQAIFHHIDGAYSLITLSDGTAVHLHANTEMKQLGDYYVIDEETVHDPKNTIEVSEGE